MVWFNLLANRLAFNPKLGFLSGGANMFQNLDKTTVLQDTRMFNVTTINVKKCNLVVTKILYLINQVNKFFDIFRLSLYWYRHIFGARF